jgi:hypothetical protein
MRGYSQNKSREKELRQAIIACLYAITSLDEG